ncbi:MAG: hypothetical protein JNJ77_21170 [Planctomycetia bacterium]|nr:hypothetical protein [Planctomycetia bacterium]
MSDSPTSAAGSSGFSRQWRTADTVSYKKLDKQSRLILLLLAVVLTGSLIGGTYFLFGTAKKPKLFCIPVFEYQQPWPSPFWFYYDDKALQETVKQKYQNPHPIQEKKQILGFLNGLSDQKETTTIIYLAGLGARRGNTVYLLPADARPDDPGSWLSMEDIFDKIKELRSEHVLLLIDIASPMTDLYRGPLINDVAEALDSWLNKHVTFEKNRLLVLTSCSKGEISHTMPSQGKSAFGYYLQKGLSGEANGFGAQEKNKSTYVTAKELASFVRNRVSRWSMENRGQPQNPRLYGTGDFDLVFVETDKPVASKNDAASPASATKPESKEEKENLVKKQLEAENRFIDTVFGPVLKNWELRDQQLNMKYLLSTSPEIKYSRLEHPEPELQFTNMWKLEKTLHLYENTSLICTAEMLKDDAIKRSIDLLLNKAEIDPKKHMDDNAKELLGSRSLIENNSLSALFPRQDPQRFDDLENVYETLFGALNTNFNSGSKSEKPAASFPPDVVLKAVKEDTENKRPGRHRDMLYLCWKKLCQSNNPTLEKCILTQQVMKAVINDWGKRPLTTNYIELQILDYLIRQQQPMGKWKFDHPQMNALFIETLHAWLQLEFLVMQLNTVFLPNGLGFKRDESRLREVRQKHSELFVKLLEAHHPRHFRTLKTDIEKLVQEYGEVLKTVDFEHQAYTAWWKSLAILQLTAEMMITHPDEEMFKYWNNLVTESIKLADIIDQGQFNEDNGVQTRAVETARQKLLKSNQRFESEILENLDNLPVDATACNKLECVLQGGMLSSENRRKVYPRLIKKHQLLHERTTGIEASDTTGVGNPPTSASPVSSQLQHASRRRDISIALLKLAGVKDIQINDTQITMDDWENCANALRHAWIQKAPEQLKQLRENKQWFKAARLEAVLPEPKTQDAIFQLHKENAKPYLEWLQDQQNNSSARWK